MTEELLEHQLNQLPVDAKVILVCPQYGTVSHSYIGTLNSDASSHPIVFQFQSGHQATIFRVGDVDKMEVTPTNITVIRLKSPHEYRETYSTVGG